MYDSLFIVGHSNPEYAKSCEESYSSSELAEVPVVLVTVECMVTTNCSAENGHTL